MVLGRPAEQFLVGLKLHINHSSYPRTEALRRGSTFQSLAQRYRSKIHLLFWLQYPIERADHRRCLTGIQTSTARDEDPIFWSQRCYSQLTPFGVHY
jgi:hypothetical protein